MDLPQRDEDAVIGGPCQPPQAALVLSGMQGRQNDELHFRSGMGHEGADVFRKPDPAGAFGVVKPFRPGEMVPGDLPNLSFLAQAQLTIRRMTDHI